MIECRWYVLHAYSGYEKKVAESIVDQANKLGISEHIEEVSVPTQHVVEVKIEYMSQFTSKKLEELKQLLETSGFVCTIYRTSPFSRISNKLNGHIYGKKIK